MPLQVHPDAVVLEAVLRRRLATSWREALSAVVDRWRELEAAGRLSPTTSRTAVREVLSRWPTLTAAAYDDIIDRLFSAGFAVGVRDTGVTVRPDQGDRAVVEWLKQSQHGFIPALEHLSHDGTRRIERVIADAYAGRDELGDPTPFDLDNMVRRVVDSVDIGEQRAELIVRTETAKATALGRISAWGADPEKDWYWYHWIATHDDRVKDVSLLFEYEGPYNHEQIRQRWEVDHNQPVLVRNRRTGAMESQVSAFNCRCSVARTPKEPLELFNEGKISRLEYESMEAA